MKRLGRAEKLTSENYVAKQLKEMEQAAVRAHQGDLSSMAAYGDGGDYQSSHQQGVNSSSSSSSKGNDSLDSWQSKKKKREQERSYESVKAAKSNAAEVERLKNVSTNSTITSSSSNKKQKKEENSGTKTYTLNDVTYLAGSHYYPLIKVDMAVEVNIDAAWTDGLIVKVNDASAPPTYDFAYLKDDDDEEETELSSVSPSDIRMVIGGDDVPSSVEIADVLLTATGETKYFAKTETVIDEDTGVGQWEVYSERTVTVEQAEKEEKERVRNLEKQEKMESEQRAKVAEAKKMETAKWANADDSALGSYNVWGSNGYKGVDVSKDMTVDAKKEEGKRVLAGGEGGFKKKAKRITNKRTSGADDE